MASFDLGDQSHVVGQGLVEVVIVDLYSFNRKINTLDEQLFCDNIRCLAFPWYRTNGLSTVVSPTDMLRDWVASLQ